MRELKPCGTVAAYMRHIRHGELACNPCLEAMAEDSRKRRGYQPFHPVECGTNSGYVRHGQLGQTPCDACRKAHSQYGRDLRARAKARKEGAE